MYLTVFLPILLGILLLGPFGEKIRHRILYASKNKNFLKPEGSV
jgi:hypothetical protein